MSFENNGKIVSFIAYESLTADQYRVMVLQAANYVRRPDAATDIPLGILQNAPAAGEAALVAMIGGGGISKVVLGGTLGAGALVALEYVGAADAGKVQAYATTQYCVGQLLEGGDEDDIAACLLTPWTVHV
jgi:hypothetical protein